MNLGPKAFSLREFEIGPKTTWPRRPVEVADIKNTFISAKFRLPVEISIRKLKPIKILQHGMLELERLQKYFSPYLLVLDFIIDLKKDLLRLVISSSTNLKT